MKEILLTQGKSTMIDDDDLEKINKLRGCLVLRRAKNGQYYVWVSIPLHRFLLAVPKGKLVDHINHDPLDNRKKNLRICTRSENGANQKVSRKNNTSGFKGVQWHKRLMRWTAQIGYNGSVLHLGYFENKLEAKEAYDRAAIELFGEFARINGNGKSRGRDRYGIRPPNSNEKVVV